jgi:hypothetical protein
MIQKNWDQTKFKWEATAGLAKAYLNEALIFNTYVFLDTFDASTNVIHVRKMLKFILNYVIQRHMLV